MHKFKHGQLHSGSKSGPEVKNRSQAIAIMMSEKKKAGSGNKEYQSSKMSKKKKKKGVHTGPSDSIMKKYGM